MLPKVRAALVKHLTPILASAPDSAVQQRDSQSDQSSNRKRKKPELRVIKPSDLPQIQPPPQQEQKKSSTPGSVQFSVSHSFLEIFNQFQNLGKKTLSRWIGNKGYEDSLQKKQKAGKFNKGSMMNIRVD